MRASPRRARRPSRRAGACWLVRGASSAAGVCWRVTMDDGKYVSNEWNCWNLKVKVNAENKDSDRYSNPPEKWIPKSSSGPLLFANWR